MKHRTSQERERLFARSIQKVRRPTILNVAKLLHIEQLAQDLDDTFSQEQFDTYKRWKRNEQHQQAQAAKRREKIKEKGGLLMDGDGRLAKDDGYSLIKLFNKRKRIMDDFADSTKGYFEQYIGEYYTDAIPYLIPVLAARLEAPAAVIEQSLHSLLLNRSGGYPCASDYAAVVWILCARETPMRMGTPIEEFRAIEYPEWTPVVTIDYIRDVQDGAVGNMYTFKCLGGQPATLTFKKFFTSKSVSWMRYYMFGISFRSCSGSTLTPQELVGMRSWVLTTPSENGRIEFERVAINDAIEKHNRSLAKDRHNKCPMDGDLPCFTCSHGLASCKRATHKNDYEVGRCDNCGDNDAMFDTLLDPNVCIGCAEGKRMARKKAGGKHE